MGVFDGYPLVVQITALVIFTPIFIAGAVGNLMVIATVVRNRRMHTATNIFISQLAVGDLLIVLFCLPFTITSIYITGEWVFGSTMCQIVKLCQGLGLSISVITLVAMSVERYFVLLRPMQARSFWNKSTALKISGAIYLLSALLALPPSLFGGMIQINIDTSTGLAVEEEAMLNGTDYLISMQCIDEMPGDFVRYFVSFRVLFLYVIPVIIITVLYTKIALYLTKSTSNQVLSNDKAVRARRKVVRMLIAMVAIFSVCWLPANVFFVLETLPNAYEIMTSEWLSWYLFLIGVLIYFNCISNPILYTFMSSQYRQAFRRMLCCCCGRPKNDDGSESRPTKSDALSSSQGAVEQKYHS